tara:strand:+ start:1206 stop:1379 length:174 start_codon:yes stop_codon:yes gene_type:complete
MTKIELLTQAMVLAITAPSDKQADQAVSLVENLAASLTLGQVEQCKAQALILLGVAE